MCAFICAAASRTISSCSAIWEAMRDYVRDLLSADYTVEAVADGKQALDPVRRERPDLVVADIMMPRLDGLSFLKCL